MLSIALPVLLLAGCPAPAETGDSASVTDTDTTDTDTTDTTPPAAPSVAMALVPDTIILGEPVDVEVTVENFIIVDPTARPAPEVVEGEGHFHITLDGEYLVAGWESSVRIQTVDFTVGTHDVAVTLMDSEHNEIDPSVSASATLTVQ